MKLYLICGKAESGKDTLGNFLKEEYESLSKKACILKITAPLYNYAINYFGWDKDENNKPRDLLQKLGIEIIKKELNLKFFLINRLNEDIKILDKFFDVGIITDGRLREEIDELKRVHEDIKVIHIKRLGEQKNLTQEQKNHITEKDLDNFYCYDYEIENNDVASLKELARKIVMKEEEYHEL